MILRATIRTSLRLAALLLLSHLVAAIVVQMTDMLPEATPVIFAVILLSLFYYLVRDVFLLFPYSWCEIQVDRDGVSVITRGGNALQGRVTGKTVVSPFFILLRIKREGRYLPVSRVIFPDALGSGLFRELCVHLRFASQPD